MAGSKNPVGRIVTAIITPAEDENLREIILCDTNIEATGCLTHQDDYLRS